MEFSKRVTRLKKHFGSQEKLAQALGMSWRTVNRWESGQAKPTSVAIIKTFERLEKRYETV